MINSVLLFSRNTILAASLCTLAACGGGSGGTAGGSVTPSALEQHRISGSVGDGPITGATITLTDANGVVLAQDISDSSAKYSVKLTGKIALPVLVTATGGTDMVSGGAPSFVLQSIAQERGNKTVNINPFTTLIVKTAMALPGGATTANVSAARDKVLGALSFGLDRNSFPDPVTTSVSDTNIAGMVKASEVVSEMIRRTTAALLLRGNAVSDDDVIAALAADLIDGNVNGAGAAGADMAVAGTANVVAAQVLVEAMMNHLKVSGADATGLLDNAIKTILGTTTTAVTANVPITADMILQTAKAVNAARTIAPGPKLDSLVTVLSAMTPDQLPATLETPLSTFQSGDFDQAITDAALASDADLATVNAAAQTTAYASDSPTGTTTGGTTGGTGTTSTQSPAVLMLSYAADRSNAVVLDGATVSSNIYVYLEPFSNIQRVEFYMDDTTASGTPIQTENGKPYDLGGTLGDRTAAPFDTTQYPNGAHTVTVRVYLTDGTYVTATSSITISNASSTTQSSGSTSSNPTPTNTVPVATNDSVSTQRDTAVAINVLANDTGLIDTPITVKIASGPANGTASVQSNGSIRYTPNSGYVGGDNLTYRITDGNGDMALGTVSVQVTCTGCGPGTIQITWNPNADAIVGYRVYFGGTATSATQLASELPLSSGLINPQSPSISYDAAVDLGLSAGSSVCFRITSYNSAGESGYSSAACTVL